MSPSRRGEAQHILIADDDDWIRNALSELLRRGNFVVTAVADGEAAREVLRHAAVDLLITDEDMPRLRGVELLRALRKTDRQLPVILISGCMPWDEPDLKGLLSPGLALEKPFSINRLLAEVRVLMGASKIAV